MYLKYEEDFLKQIIACCEDMSEMVMEGNTEFRINSTDDPEFFYMGNICRFCPFCGEQINFAKLY